MSLGGSGARVGRRRVISRMGPEVLLSQARCLGADLRAQAFPIAERAAAALQPLEGADVGSVYLTGSGDSLHASFAAEMAFEEIADLRCHPVGARRFADYAARGIHPNAPVRTLVVAISASGKTPGTLRAIRAAHERGALTIAVTGVPGSPVSQAADRTLLVDLASNKPSPGIRTYQASLLGLLLLAVRLAEARVLCSLSDAHGLRTEIAAVAPSVDATVAGATEACREIAREIADAPAVMAVGGGPSYGTALFFAAKLTEAAGVLALGQDLEEWWHVERFAGPPDLPMFVIAPPGRSSERAIELTAGMREIGRRVIVVTQEGDRSVAAHAHAVLPIHGSVREEFSPLLYHAFAGCMAAFVAEHLGSEPFSDR